ncbi:hypothetical protein ACF1G3_38195, partial [Streptomyces rochei]
VDLDQLRLALQAADPARAVLAALIAFHGLPPRQLRTLPLIALRDGRLHLPGRTIVLADPVRTRLTTYLAHRNRRWPGTANPHLFLNHRTACLLKPVRADWITLTLGMSAQAVLEDRILYEALATRGDIRRLCDLFGLSVEGAQRYTDTLDQPAIAHLRQQPPQLP